MLQATYELLATTTLAWRFVATPDRNGSIQLKQANSADGSDPAGAAPLSRWARRLWGEARRDRPPASNDCIAEIARVMFVLRTELYPQQGRGREEP